MPILNILRLVRRVFKIFLPEICMICVAIWQPSYIMPFLYHPIGWILIFLMLLWSGVGLYMLKMPKVPLALKIAWWLCEVPLLLVPMLGPAVLTIIQALGPITR